MRVYQASKFGEPAPYEMIVWDLVFRTGWTIEYIENMSVARLDEYIQICEGYQKAMSNG